VRRNTAGIALLLALLSCVQQEPLGPNSPTGAARATLLVQASLVGTPVARLVVQVSAPDISPPAVFNIPIANGMAAGTITLTAGSQRVLTLQAYDAGGVETDSGSVTITVQPGTNPPVSIVLTPLTGNLPITATLGSFTVSVTPAAESLTVGDTAKVTASILDANGHPVTDQVTWATLAPTVASVVSTSQLTSRITAIGPGQTTVFASYGGVGASVAVKVVASGAPTLVQHVSTPNTHNSLASVFNVVLPNKTLAGNAIVVAFQISFGGTVKSVTDNQGNKYTAGPSTGSQCFMYYTLGATAGVTRITVTLSTTGAYFSAVAAEFAHVATATAADGSNGANSSNNSVSTWSTAPISTTADGDLLYYVGFDLSYSNMGTPPDFSGVATLGAGLKFAAADLQEGAFAAYTVQSTHGSVTPSLTVNAPRRYGALALALKGSAASGTLPGPGIRIVRIQHGHMDTGTSAKMQFPSTGNLIVLGWTEGDGTFNISNLGDTQGNTYTQVSGSPITTGAGGTVQLYYAANAISANDLLLSLSLTGSSIGSEAVLYDVTGAATAPFDVSATASGSYPMPATQFTSVALTPAGAGELVVAHGDQDTGTMTGLVGTGYIFDMPTWGGQDEGGAGGAGNQFTLDAQAGHYYTLDASRVTFTWTATIGNGSGTNDWETIAAAFKPR